MPTTDSIITKLLCEWTQQERGIGRGKSEAGRSKLGAGQGWVLGGVDWRVWGVGRVSRELWGDVVLGWDGLFKIEE